METPQGLSCSRLCTLPPLKCCLHPHNPKSFSSVGISVLSRIQGKEEKRRKENTSQNIYASVPLPRSQAYKNMPNWKKLRNSSSFQVNISEWKSLSRVRLFATPWTAARPASLSNTNSWNLLKLLSIESVMPSNHLILCCPLLLRPSIFPSIRVFSNKSVLHISG